VSDRELWPVWLGRVPYAEALELQRAVARARIAGAIPQDVLLLVEHPPVVTLGRSSKQQHLVASVEFLAQRGVELFEVERGGDVTFHGPGQLVGYPILDLQGLRPDLHWYLRSLEDALIQALERLGVPADRNPGYTGVWSAGRKMASIGIHVRRWVTFHGFALNVATDLDFFDLIVPCGIRDVVMTSVLAERATDGEPADPAALWTLTRDAVVAELGRVLDRAPVAAEEALEEVPA
jgi:lipoyl(octanoyl) transferase